MTWCIYRDSRWPCATYCDSRWPWCHILWQLMTWCHILWQQMTWCTYCNSWWPGTTYHDSRSPGATYFDSWWPGTTYDDGRWSVIDFAKSRSQIPGITFISDRCHNTLTVETPVQYGHQTQKVTSVLMILENGKNNSLEETGRTRMPAFWGYPPPPHDYPYHWVILDPKSKEDKVKVTNLKNLPKFQIFEFWNGHYTRHTFWSCLIRCANMK